MHCVWIFLCVSCTRCVCVCVCVCTPDVLTLFHSFGYFFPLMTAVCTAHNSVVCVHYLCPQSWNPLTLCFNPRSVGWHSAPPRQLHSAPTRCKKKNSLCVHIFIFSHTFLSIFSHQNWVLVDKDSQVLLLMTMDVLYFSLSRSGQLDLLALPNRVR